MDDWGERTRLACGFGRRARTIVGQISLKGFRRDAENGNRDGCAPRTKSAFRIGAICGLKSAQDAAVLVLVY
jgi:hypothetical protein